MGRAAGVKKSFPGRGQGTFARNDPVPWLYIVKSSPPCRRIAFLGNYVPRRCGIATFTSHLCEAVARENEGAHCVVAAVSDRPEGYDYPPRVRIELQERDVETYRAAADALNESGSEVLCVQHEFGIYGGAAGSHLMALLDEVRMPVVATLHTVLQRPDGMQRRVMDALVRRCDRLVVMAEAGREVLREVYGVSEPRVEVIPHGIPDVPLLETDGFKPQFGVEGRKVLLTFGLLGPGKGIEFAIRAMPEIAARHPQAIYLVVGATHPHLLAREGEKYRTRLEHLAEDLGVGDRVVFFNRFVTSGDLEQFIGAADIYLTPYVNEEQITSGTLAQVFGAGRVVVSTPYCHARELLAEGRGVLVPFGESAAIAEAVNGLLDDPARMRRIRSAAHAAGRPMIWPTVARRYLDTFSQVAAARRAPAELAATRWAHAIRPGKLPPQNLHHVIRMTDGTGMLQHAIFNVPNHHEGYCTDDNARAFILCNLLQESPVATPASLETLDQLATRYLAFLANAYHEPSGRFRNFMSYDRKWLEEIGSEDSHGRALWALGTGAARSHNPGHRGLCAGMFTRAMAVVERFTSPRAWSFTLLGLHELEAASPGHPDIPPLRGLLVERLLDCWRRCADDEWQWFENSLTYDNARLCQALVQAGGSHPRALEAGLSSLGWLAARQTSPTGCFRPVGSNGFHEKNGGRADYDQQPVEAQAMVAACLEAFRSTHDESWWREARRAFDWFLGRNDLAIPLHDPSSGGCRDALHEHRANENQGAESTLAFQLALAEMTAAEHSLNHPSLPSP